MTHMQFVRFLASIYHMCALSLSLSFFITGKTDTISKDSIPQKWLDNQFCKIANFSEVVVFTEKWKYPEKLDDIWNLLNSVISQTIL